MKVIKEDGVFVAELYFKDLIPKVQEELLELLGDNGNYDIYPFATISADIY